MSLRHSTLIAAAAAVVLVATAVGCGGSSPSAPTTPTTTTPPTTTPPTTTPPTTGGGTLPTSATITIGADGVASPLAVTIARGGRITFTNNHSRSHDMSSDPHPEHTDCPELNQVGFLSAGQSRTSGNLNTARTCGFHDHNEPSNNSLKGRITIQ